jgi:hypothetical protein
MPEGNLRNDYSALYETVERIRKERFSDLDPELIREIMKLHADPDGDMSGAARAVDEAIAKRVTEAE